MPLRVSSHPVVADCLARLRDRDTDHEQFRLQARKLMTLLLYEATADLPVEESRVETPLGPASGRRLAREVVAVPVLRAGLGILPPLLELLPTVSVGYLGLERDEETAVARIYYRKLPPMDGKLPVLLDPMLATGGSASRAMDLIKEAGGRDIRMICVVAAPEGVAAIESRHAEVMIHTAALDERLDERSYIVPGLGDFGDRLFGTG